MTPDLAWIHEMLEKLEGVVSQHDRLLAAAEGSPLLSRKAADKLYSPAVMQQELGAAGTRPLALTGLPGTAGQTQPANAPVLSALPEPGNPSIKVGDIFTFQGVTYRRDANANTPLTGTASATTTVTGGGVASGGGGGGVIGATIIQDTWAHLSNYPAANYKPGTIYEVITDRPGLYYQINVVSSTNTWQYAWGTLSLLQASVAALVATLTANDLNLLINVTDYGHILQCTGATAIGWGPAPELGSNYYALGDSKPPGGVWHAVDGSTVNYLKSDGTLGSKTLVASTAAYLKIGSGADGALHAPVAPTFTGSASQSTSNDVGATQTALTGVGVTLPAEPHTHTITPAGTISTTGQPENFFTSLWFRQ